MGRVSRRSGRPGASRPPSSPGSAPTRPGPSPTRTPGSWRVAAEAAERAARSFEKLYRLALIRERSLQSKREGRA